MLKTAFLAALCCVAFSGASEARARQHHRHHSHHRHYHRQVVLAACADIFCWFGGGRQESAPVTYPRRRHARQPVSYAATSLSWQEAVGRPSRFIAGRLVCAINVNAWLAERGIRGTGSALALSFRTWGRSAGGPVPGAVIVSARRGGGHVAIVSRVVNGVVYAWNATGGQRGWREIPYRHSVLDYRVPG